LKKLKDSLGEVQRSISALQAGKPEETPEEKPKNDAGNSFGGRKERQQKKQGS